MWLVSSFFDMAGDFRVKEFYGEHLGPSLRTEESQEIQNFRERRNPYHVLVKSENGKPNLKKVFAALVDQLLRIEPQIVFLVDLDGGNLRSLVSDLNEQIQQRHSGRELKIGEYAIEKQDRDMVSATCEVLTRTGNLKGTFDIVAFKQTFERVAEISRDDEPDVRKRQIKEFLEDEDHVRDRLDSVLLPTE